MFNSKPNNTKKTEIKNIKSLIKTTLNLAIKSFNKNEVPVGAIIINENEQVVSKAFNKKEFNNNILDHAEIIAIKKLSKKIKTWKLNKYILISSLEPCSLCKEVIKHSRIKKVFYLAKQNKKVNYKYDSEFIESKTASKVITEFFRKKL